MKINWKTDTTSIVDRLTFNDLKLNESFRIIGSQAIYVKTRRGYHIRDADHNYHMYEIATGQLYTPTTSGVEHIGVAVTIDVPKPNIYL